MTFNAPLAPGPTVEFVAAQRRQLEVERDKILATLAVADHDLAELRDQGGVAEVDFSEEGGEGSSTASERGHIEALKAQLGTRLADVDAAIGRIDSGLYGICESCGGPIGEARLDAMPEATLCVTCKSSPWTRRR
jgi:RNA polymerase-binding transcription factor DksA